MKLYVRSFAEKYLTKLLSKADIEINGGRSWDIQVKDNRFFEHVFLGGSLGLGESYMKGWWECSSLDDFFYRLLSNKINRSTCNKPFNLYRNIKSFAVNHQSKKRAFIIGEHHYNAGNDLFELMLDSSMTYSCGYWRNADNLDEAQKNKLDLICRKLGLQPGMRMLDIGCGWGGLIAYAAREYGVETVGLTVSEEQATFVRQRYSDLPVKVHLMDYREVSGKFDAITSVGMFEHVGFKNYSTFMKVADEILTDNGLFLLHTMGSNTTVKNCDPWFDKYIFPNGMVPSIKQIGSAIENHFVMEDWQNFGADYDRTLLAWLYNFEKNWDKINDTYSQTFFRMWRYYLLCLAGCFRARSIQVWQVVLSHAGGVRRHRSIRCHQC